MPIKEYNSTIRNLEQRLRSFRSSINAYISDAVRDNESRLVSYIADSQLFRHGINGEGVKIMSYAPYTALTVKIKKAKGQPYNRVTLRDTQAFHRAMRVVIDSDGFYVTSDDYKTELLVEKYGPLIFRPTNKNLTLLVRKYIKNELQKKLKEAIRQ